jgi:hypothetical protein
VYAARIALVQQQVDRLGVGRIDHAWIVPNTGAPVHTETTVIPAYEPGSMTLISWEMDPASSAG